MGISNGDLLTAVTTSLSPLLPKPSRTYCDLASDKQDRMKVFSVLWVTGHSPQRILVHSLDTMALWLMANSCLRDHTHRVTKYNLKAEDAAASGSQTLYMETPWGKPLWWGNTRGNLFSFSFFQSQCFRTKRRPHSLLVSGPLSRSFSDK